MTDCRTCGASFASKGGVGRPAAHCPSCRERRRSDDSAWRKVREQTLIEEPICRLQLPGCTRISTHADHIVPLFRGGARTARTNLQGACANCNSRKGSQMPGGWAFDEARPPALKFFD